ncbi:casein kinase I, partial [Cladochytrium tenue]
PSVVGGHYKVGRKIGEGSFGVIHEGLNLNNNAPIAIKFESRRSDAPQLRDEFRTYKILAGSFGVPTAYYFGQEGHQNVLCIDLLGPSLEDLFELCRRRFSVKTVCMVAKQMVSRIQTLHEHDLIYRDIKPDNFLVGRISRHDPTPICSSHNPEHPHPAAIVYLVDYGMAKRFRDAKSGQHIPYREKKSLSGTARYMSVNTHLGREQSRRDDLESLGHVFMYFLRGSLPWQGLKAPTNKQKYEKIGEKKQAVSPAELGKGHPDEFITYLSYTKGLRFDEEPDYHYLISLFDKVLARAGEVDDGVFDWMPVLDAQRREKERARESVRLERERSSRSGLPRSVVDHAGARMPRATSPMSAAPVVSSSSVDLPAIPSPNPSGLSHIAAAAIAATPSTVAVARSTVQIGDSDPHLAQLTLSPPSSRKMHSAQSPGVATTSMPPAVYARRASVAAAGVNGGAEFEVARSRRTSGGLPRHSVASSRSTPAAPPPGSSAVAPAEFGSGRRRRASEVRRSMAESDALKRPGASLGPVASGDSDEETSPRPRRPSADGGRREVKKSEDVKGSDAMQADGAAAARPRRRRRPWFFRLCTCGGGTDEIAE